VAFVLAFIATQLKPRQQKNVDIEKKRNILSSINVVSTTENAEALFERHIIEMITVRSDGTVRKATDALNIDLKKEFSKPEKERNLPLYFAKVDDGSIKYIIPLIGKGLWGPITGYISLNEDMKTVFGAIFMHKSETPGLGAEIATPQYQSQFAGKEIFDTAGSFTSVKVVKGGADKSDIHAVDAITGGTITSNGLNDMLFNCLTQYNTYFKNQVNK